jgi:BMFP domain-containing protein YqiC
MQLIGASIIVGVIVWAAFFVSRGKPFGARGWILLIVAPTFGLALVYPERAIEISIPKFATIKAAAQQATTDAQAIASIRQRVEAQAATLDLVAKESADAKRLLGDLRKENEIADAKLKQLDQKTSQIVNLPDGRMRMGYMVTGTPSVLLEHFDSMLKAYKDKKDDVAYSEAKISIKLYEDTKQAITTPTMSTGDLDEGNVALLYGMGSELALRFSDNDTALAWAKVSVAAKASPENNIMLYTTLLKVEKMPNDSKNCSKNTAW